MSSDLIDTTEMYLRTILELEEEGIVPLRARISERLHHSGPTVSQTVSRMERDDLVRVSEDRRLEFTEKGRMKAVQVMRKHRLAERLLADVIGLDWHYVHDEACRWEHVMSERVERKIYALLDAPTVSPYGNPIPGLEALGDSAPTVFHVEVIDAATLLSESGAESVTGEIRRLAEPIQVDPDLLLTLQEAQVLPGNEATFTRVDGGVNVQVKGSDMSVDLSRESAGHIFLLDQ